MFDPRWQHERLSGKIRYLGGDATREGGCVKESNRRDGRFPSDQVCPENVLAKSVWRNDAKTSNHNLASMIHTITDPIGMTNRSQCPNRSRKPCELAQSSSGKTASRSILSILARPQRKEE